MIPCGDIHHLRLTVTDVQRSREFYTGLLGFQVVVESPPPGDPAADEVFKLLFGGVVMARGNLIMGLRPMAPAADRFHPDRAGLDHLSFGVPARGDLEQAVRLFDERGVTHGEITRLPSFGIDVLSFEDPDGIQLELTAPVPADGGTAGYSRAGNCMHIRKVTMPRLTRQDFERLLEFRVTLRRFHRWSEDQAQAEGLTHVQHQLLVAIKGHHENQPPTMGDLAGYLMLRPHSTVELVDRAEAAGLVERTPDGEDGRVVRVRLTRDGDRVLHKLTRAHLDRLRELATVLDELVAKHDAAEGA